MSDYRFPELPEGQRWKVRREWGFPLVSVQERRWWGWRTIASTVGDVAYGREELTRCIDHIQRRDYFARLQAERGAERAQRRREIPYGTHP